MVRKEEEVEQLSRQVKTLTQDLREARDECRTTELELLQELDMLQDKNSVMRSVFGSWERRGGRGRGRCVQGRVSHDRVGAAAGVGYAAGQEQRHEVSVWVMEEARGEGEGEM